MYIKINFPKLLYSAGIQFVISAVTQVSQILYALPLLKNCTSEARPHLANYVYKYYYDLQVV
jgi:hypothetical protein